MRDNDIAFLAEMILKLVPFGAKVANEVGEQIDRSTPFSREDVDRLFDIRDFTPPSSPQTRENEP